MGYLIISEKRELQAFENNVTEDMKKWSKHQAVKI
jgi:hypothetical protein